jgi:hypothetical protein
MPGSDIWIIYAISEGLMITAGTGKIASIDHELTWSKKKFFSEPCANMPFMR